LFTRQGRAFGPGTGGYAGRPGDLCGPLRRAGRALRHAARRL